MGALVQVLGANAATVATAFTDQHGRYSIANLAPGSYMVRASATLFVPATKNNLQLRTGAKAVVNLTLAVLFDTASWLPAERRRPDEADDEWKWTLRSTANRPILRVLDDGSIVEVSPEASRPGTTSLRNTIEGGDGFGRSGVHDVLTMHRATLGGEMMVRSDLGLGPMGSGSEEIAGGYERTSGLGDATRMVMSYSLHPELVGSDGNAGVKVLRVASGQRMMMGEQVEVEAGGALEGVQAGQTGFVAHPFLRVTARPVGAWTLQYQLATERELQGYDDLTGAQREVPVALVEDGRVELERGTHQAISVARQVGRGSVEVAYYHDTLHTTALNGGGMSEPTAGMVLDSESGYFRTLGPGYNASGTRISISSPLAAGFWVAAEYSTGAALEPGGGQERNVTEAVGGLKARGAQTATLAIKGRLLGSGTRVRASYRWQPSGALNAVDPYSPFSDQAYLSCRIRQPIHVGRMQGLDATIDVTNLLAQGYRPFLSADGRTLYFAQAPRTYQAGLSFSF